jgi:hypothetical protein
MQPLVATSRGSRMRGRPVEIEARDPYLGHFQ